MPAPADPPLPDAVPDMVPDGPGATTDHYFTAHPASAGELRPLRVRLAGRELELVTARGVFSPDRLDLGTRVLLETAPPPPATGELLDLGCGWGPIALTLGLLAPDARVWAVDVNERALDLVRRNAAKLGLENVHAVLPGDVPGDVALAALWSNPPIRVGKAALHEMLLRWLPRLAPGAQAHLVVQRNLGADSLQRWLGEQLGAQGAEPADGPAAGPAAVTRVETAKGFRVLRVDQAGPSTAASAART